MEADDGCIGEDPTKTKVPASMVHDQDDKRMEMRSRVRRHETCNKRLKQFKCIDTVFRHDIEFHGTCFRACAVLTQLELQNGHPLFPVDECLDKIAMLYLQSLHSHFFRKLLALSSSSCREACCWLWLQNISSTTAANGSN